MGSIGPDMGPGLALFVGKIVKVDKSGGTLLVHSQARKTARQGHPDKLYGTLAAHR